MNESFCSKCGRSYVLDNIDFVMSQFDDPFVCDPCLMENDSFFGGE